MSARFPVLPDQGASNPPKTLLEKIVEADGPPMISDADSQEIIEDMRRLYALTERISFEQPAPQEVWANPLTASTIPDGFTKLESNTKPFDVISGRLGMGTTGPCYKVTPEEMARRIDGVEQLNSSNLANNLKKTKQKNGGEIMRAQLAEHGIRMNLNAHRREAPTRIISLVEGEALHLAADLQDICAQSYPTREIAQEVINEAGNNKELMEALSDTTSFLECMSALGDAFRAVDPPLSGVVPKPSKDKKLNHSTEKFSCATHGFGIATQRIWADEMKKIGEEMAIILGQQQGQDKKLNRRK